MRNFVYNAIGFISAASLALILWAVLPKALRGDFSPVATFMTTYPGIQPFFIFMFPVIVVAGLGWLWRWIKK